MTSNMEVNVAAPLDARTVVKTKDELYVLDNFRYRYVGMPVFVQEEGELYYLLNKDVTQIESWKKIGDEEMEEISSEELAAMWLS